jgi:hypothetical protein
MRHLSSLKEVSLHSLHADYEDDTFRIFNPSVAVFENRLISTFRATNIERADRNSKFYLLPPGREMRNELVIGELNDDFSLARQVQVDLKDRNSGAPLAPGGIEDVRIVVSPDGRLEGMGCLPLSGFRIKPGGGLGFGSEFLAKMARIQFGPGYELGKLTVYDSPFKRRMEKNWAPFYWEGKFCVVYQWNPLIVLELLPDGATRFVKWFKASDQLKGLRGSSQGIATANGFLFIVHRKYAHAGKVRFAHHFIELGPDLQPLRLSEGFGLISSKQIEYCAGVALFKNRCLLSFGLNDSLPFLLEMDAEMVERLLTQRLTPIAEDQAAMASPGQAAALQAAAEFPEIVPPNFMKRLKIKGREFAVRIAERILPIG